MSSLAKWFKLICIQDSVEGLPQRMLSLASLCDLLSQGFAGDGILGEVKHVCLVEIAE
jgi:hypothetical protein